jgi:hypothetical protein
MDKVHSNAMSGWGEMEELERCFGRKPVKNSPSPSPQLKDLNSHATSAVQGIPKTPVIIPNIVRKVGHHSHQVQLLTSLALEILDTLCSNIASLSPLSTGATMNINQRLSEYSRESTAQG